MLNKYIAGLGVLGLVLAVAACDSAPEVEVQDFADDTVVVEEPMDDFGDDTFMIEEDDLIEVEVVEDEYEDEDMDAEL